MVSRRGSAFSGCLTLLLLTAAVGYLGYHVGQPYYRYYEFRDAIEQAARFATMHTDDRVREIVWTAADSLSLPEAAYHVGVERTSHAIHIRSSYDDQWTLGRYVRPVHFKIDVEHPL